METYSITIKETLLRIISIDAESSDEALDIASEMYKSEEIVLDAEDHAQTDIYPTLLYDIDNNQVFREFLLDKVQNTLPELSAAELAEIAFGSLQKAAEVFQKI